MKLSKLVVASLLMAGFAFGLTSLDKVDSKTPCEAAAVEQDKLVKHSTVQCFDKDVLQAKTPVLVDFYASWCGPCRMMAPTIDKLAQFYKGKVKVYKVDIDKNPELAAKYGIVSIPAVKIFKGGEIVDETLGLVPGRVLADKLNVALSVK